MRLTLDINYWNTDRRTIKFNLHVKIPWILCRSTSVSHFGAKNPRGATELRVREPKTVQSKGGCLVRNGIGVWHRGCKCLLLSVLLRNVLGQFRDILSRSVLLSYSVNRYPDTRLFIFGRQEAHNSNHWCSVIRMLFNRSITSCLSKVGKLPASIEGLPLHPTLSVYRDYMWIDVHLLQFRALAHCNAYVASSPLQHTAYTLPWGPTLTLLIKVLNFRLGHSITYV